MNFKDSPPVLSPGGDGLYVLNAYETVLLTCESADVTIQKLHQESEPVQGNAMLVEDMTLGLDQDAAYSNDELNASDDYIQKRVFGFFQNKQHVQVKIFHCIQPANQPIVNLREAAYEIVGKNIGLIQNADQKNQWLSEIQSASGIKKAGQPVVATVPSEGNSNNPKLKIRISREGLYVLPQALVRKSGWELSNINPRLFRIRCAEGEVPIRVTGEEDGSFDFTDAIEFWGEPIWDKTVDGEKRLDVNSNDNVYWLEIGDKPGIRMGQEEGWLSNPDPSRTVSSRFYPYEQHFEKDLSFNRLAYAMDVEDSDYWLYTSGINGGEKRQVSFDLLLPDPFATDLAKIRLRLRGLANSLTSQSVDIYINDKWVASGTWRGHESFLLEGRDISPTILSERGNILTVINRSTEEELAPLALDWFELEYPKSFEAKDDFIRFRAPQNSAGKVCRFQIEKFNSRTVDVYKIGSGKITGCEVETVTDTLGNVTRTLRFDDEIVNENTQYAAMAPNRKLLPDSVELIGKMNLKNGNRGAEYIFVVSTADSLGTENLEELVQHREKQGLKTAIVRVDSIYNEFNSGISHPIAIRRFLQFASKNWNPSPRFVLLVGNGTYSNRLPLEKGNIVPTRLVPTTKYGAAASDNWYVLLDGDDYPDMAVGRLPIQNTIELKSVIDKILNYEKSPSGPWKNRYVMIGADYTGQTLFRNQSETFIRELCPKNVEPKRLYVWGQLNDPNVGAKSDLMQYFKEGVGYINFRGHGGGAIWADSDLLNLEDVVTIDNQNRLPIISSMTCFTGDFTSKCLGSALVKQEKNGAVAFWGSSGTGWTYADYNLLREFYSLAFGDTSRTLGELIRLAKNNYLLTDPSELGISEINQYNLLGDPAICLSFPESRIPITMENRSISFTDSVRIRSALSGQASQILLEWTGANASTVSQWTQSATQNEWRTSLAVPSGFRENDAGLRAYAWNDKTGYHANGYVSFSIGKSFFDSLKTTPSKPTSRDSIRFSARVQEPAGIKRIWCKVLSPKPDSILAAAAPGTGQYATVRNYNNPSPGSTLAFFFLTENLKGIISRSDTAFVQIPSLPDLAAQSIRMSGADRVLIESEIRNFGMEPVQLVRVRFECPEIAFQRWDTVSVEGNQTVSAQVPFPAFSGLVTCLVRVNPDSAVKESSYGNNLLGDRFRVNRFNITPESGSINLDKPGSIGFPGEINCLVPAGAVSKQSVLQIEVVMNERDAIPGTDIYRFLIVNNPSAQFLSKEMTILFHPVSDDSSLAYKPYFFDESSKRWVLCGYTVNDSGMAVQTARLGLYRMVASEDHQPPLLELQVDQQQFVPGGYVSKSPAFSLTIQDSSGVDIRPDRIRFILDDVEQASDQMTLPDSSLNPTQVTVLFRPVLQPGNHTIQAKASDVHGNIGQTERMVFSVSETFSLRYLGNHPNPFKRETVFAYTLTDAAERISLKIYTVSGRRVRIFEDPEMSAPDYHEVVWDGEDEWGEEVANGVYFFRLNAEADGMQQEITGKIARLR